MKFLNILLSILLVVNPAFGATILEGTQHKIFERLQTPKNQATKVADKYYKIETGSENKLKNPDFTAGTLHEGWTVTGATAFADDTFYFEGPKSLGLTLPTGAQTNVKILQQSYTTAGGELSGSNLEVSARIAKSILKAGVDLKLCLDIDTVQKNCVSVPSSPSDSAFDTYAFNFPAKQGTTPVVYDVYLIINYGALTAPVGVLNVQKFYFGPARNIAKANPGLPVTSYTPTLTGISALNGTAKTDPEGKYWVKDDRLFVEAGFRNGTGGAASGNTGNNVALSLPAGFTINDSKSISTLSGFRAGGICYVSNVAGGASSGNTGIVHIASGIIRCMKTTNDFIKVSDIGAGSFFVVKFDIPINESYGQDVITPNNFDTDAVTENAAISGSSSNPSPGGGAVLVRSWRMVGDSMDITFVFTQSTAGSAGSGVYLFPLPTGYIADPLKVNIGTNGVNTVGTATVFATGVTYTGSAHVYITSGSTSFLAIAVGASGTATANVGSSFLPVSTAQMRYTITARVPIDGKKTSQRAPQLLGSVTSADETSAYYEFAANVISACTSSPCTISSREGSQISQISRAGTGAYSASLTGLTNSPLWCNCTSVGASDQTCTAYNLTSSSIGNIRVYSVAGSSQDTNQLRVWCKVKR